MRYGSFGIAIALLCAMPAEAQDRTKKVSLGKNVRLDIRIGTNTATTKPTPPTHSPVVIAVDPTMSASYSGSDNQFAGHVARALDESGKVKAVSAARMAGSDTGAYAIDAMTRSERIEYIDTRCMKFALDYLAVGNTETTGTSVSASTYVMGFGRSGTTAKSTISVIECKTREPVWVVSLETKQTSGNVAAFAGGGNFGQGGSGQSAAVATALTEALVSDMGW